MRFQTDMDLEQYGRESSQDTDMQVPEDVKIEQEKIANADGLALVFPLWWSDCPAKLKGWFDRVWTYGYAYLYDQNGEHVASKIDIRKALVLCTAGHTVGELEETGIVESMRRVMVHDRLLGVGIRHASLEILGGMVEKTGPARNANLEQAYRLGRTF